MGKNSEATLLIRIKEAGAEALNKVKSGLEEVSKYANIAAGAIVAFLIASVKNFSDAQEASNRLSQAIKNQGLDVSTLKKQYDELAAALAAKSTYDDNEIVNALALAQAQAGQIKLSKELIQATLDYAAATGTDLNSAFEKVGKSIGTSTNALAREGIQLDETASSAEKMAEITRELSLRFDGQAEVLTKSSTGAVKQMMNALGDLSEVVGEFLSPAVIAVTREFIQMILATKEFLTTSRFVSSFMEETAKAFIYLNGLLDKGAIGFRMVAESVRMLVAQSTFDMKSVAESKKNFQFLADEMEVITKKTKNEQLDIEKKFIAKRAGVVIESEEKIAKEQIKTQRTVSSAKQKEVEEELKRDKIAAQKAIEEFKDFEYQRLVLIQETNQKAAEDHKKRMEQFAAGASSFITGGIQSAAQKGLETLTDTFLPGFGAASGQMFALLAQDSEAFAKSMNQMFSTQFVENIGQNVVTLLETISEKLPEVTEALIESLVENSPNIVAAMFKAMHDPSFHERMALAIANGFANGVRDGFGKGFFGAEHHISWHFEQGIVGGFHKAFDRLKDQLEDLLTVRMPGSGGGGKGGGGNIIGAVVGGAIGGPAGAAAGWNLASVGTVKPLYAAGGAMVPRGTDTVPAMLTPGEFVVRAPVASRNQAELQNLNNGGSFGGASSGNTYHFHSGILFADQAQAMQFAKAIDSELLKLRQANRSVAFDKATF